MMRIWATSMVLAAALVSGSTAKAADLAFEVVAVSSPSPSDTTAVLPGSLTDAIIGETYYLEVWVSDVGDINTGVTSAYVDLTWSGALAAGVSVGHGSIFNSLVTGSIGTGLVDELGGSTFSGSVGVEPTWARVATVTVQADSAGQVSYVLVASSTGCAAFGRGVIGWPDIDLGAGALVTQASLVDCNSNGVSDAQEIIAGTSGDCNNNGVPDECDITTGTSGDCNSSSIPDECERQTAFASQVIISTSANVARSVFAADLDGDGDADVLSASEVDDKIAWYENTDGLGTFGPQQIITTAANAAFSVFAADLDGDGDADVLTASVSDDTIAWYENIDGLGDFDSQHIITTAADGAISIYAVDLDGDGDFDVLSASDHVAWYENIDGLGNFGPQKAISAINYSLYSVIAADLDGDGDADALSVSVDDGKTAWYKNIDGLGTFGQENVIGTTPYAAFSIFAADLDGDGDTDVLSESSYEGKFVWYENTDGLGGFGPEKVITTSAYGVQAVAAADLDRDGDLDVLAGATVENEIAWYENTDGRGSFGPQQIITTDTNSPYGVITADLDGDGDLDVVSASDSDNKIAWYENIALNDCNQNGTLDECDIDGATSTDCNNNSMPDECEIMSGALGDCNSNGLPDECELDQNDCNSNAIPDECELDCNLNGVPDECDIANSSSSDCNNNGVPDVCEIASGSVDDCNANSIPDDCELQTVFLSQKTITNAANFAFSVFAADLDSDGDADILSASVYDDKIAWYENTDGLGGFGSQQVITTAADGASSVFAEDLDGDGDLDVLSASRNVAKIAWYENTDGLGGFGPQQTISIAADGAHSVFAVDLDGDRDPDVLSASIFDNKIAWYENTDGQGVFGPQQVITTAAIGAISVFAVDLDGDGDTDVISASSDDDKIAWYENSDGLGTFGPQHVITTAADVARSVFAADLDGDGDADVLSASGYDNKIAWYENTDGLGTFGPQQVITTAADGASSVFAADLDGDGNMDVLSASVAGDKISWYQNTDGAGDFGPQQTITTAADGARSVFAADFDSDGDLDVLSASDNDNKIAWYENSKFNDCNDNGTLDGCDIAEATSADCNTNGTPDECDISASSEIAEIINLTGDGIGNNLYGPEDIAVDTVGNIYVTGIDSNNAFKITPEGAVSEIINSSGDGIGNFLYRPFGIAVDGTANVYVSGFVSQNVFKITPGGIITEIIDASDGLIGPSGVVVDGLGNVYVAGVLSDNVFKISQGGVITEIINASAGLEGPEVIVTDAVGNVYVTGHHSNNAFKITPTGVITEIINSTGDGLGNVLEGPYAITVDAADNAYVTGYHSNNAFKISPGGGVTEIIDTDGDSLGNNLDRPYGIAVDDAGYVYVAGIGSSNVFRISPGGVITQIMDSADGLSFAIGMTVDALRNVYVTGQFSDNAFMIPGPTSKDCNANGIPDGCDITTGTSGDCNINSVPDECDIANAASTDCNANGIPDECDITTGTSGDCNINWVPDECDIANATSTDCNNNGAPDECEVAGNDCNANATPDDCELASNDCNANAIPDECDADCNNNGMPDGCEVFADCNDNGVPDDCELQTVFSIQRVITNAADGAISVFAADLDGDGDSDVISASILDDRLAWYENTDGLGGFGPLQTISIAADGPRSVFAADLDGDGDLDVFSASQNDDKIAWYENTDGLGGFGPQQVITTEADFASSVFAADLDGDGDFDVLSASQFDSKIAWYENTDGMGSFGSQQVITTAAFSAFSVFAADLDGDGDADVLSASSGDDEIAWYENTDGLGGFGPQQVITTAADGAQAVSAADLDGDGDVDVLSASFSDDKIAWYENTNGLGGFGPQQVITTENDRPYSVIAADLDADGDADVLSASLDDDKIAWHENTDGLGNFGAPKIITTAADRAESVFAADLDGDGDLDVLSASLFDDKIAWYENRILNDCNENGTHDDCDIANATSTDCNNDSIPDECELPIVSSDQRVISTAALRPVSIFAADLDGDGDFDALSASQNDFRIAWYENTNGAGSFGPQQTITTAAMGAASVFSADLDGDGDADVLSASRIDDKIAWYENTDGLGGFGPQLVITTAADGAFSVFAADLDGDGDADVLSASYTDDKIAWYENIDGLGSFGPQQVITTAADFVQSVFAADLDGDGDADVLSASQLDNKIAWYENTDGLGSFGPQQVITTLANVAVSVFAADVDGDGDLDVLSASNSDDKIAWYENTDGLGGFGSQQTITTAARGAISVFAVDLDVDGDIDVLSASFTDDKIAWYENTDGLGSFGLPQVIADTTDFAYSVFAADLDGDGDADVLSASSNDDTIAWYENSTINDCNENGTPDYCDIADATSTDCNNNNVPDECESDCNANGIPDECDIAADFNGNGTVDLADLAAFAGCLTNPCAQPLCAPLYVDSCCAIADFEGDGDVDLNDFAELQKGFSEP